MSKKYILDLINMPDELLDEYLYSVDVQSFKSALEKGLKEQDRDTRHACAESVMKIDEPLDPSAISMIAHDACMNCNEGLKVMTWGK